MTASGDPAADTRFAISPGETVLGSSDFCDVEAEERVEMAESMEEVRGTLRDPAAMSAMADATDGFDEAWGGGPRAELGPEPAVEAEGAASLRS